jgi:hypothetical protein
MTKANVIIITAGETGSSVLIGLIARAGFWTGDETFQEIGIQRVREFRAD